jgi:hypothetical protein
MREKGVDIPLEAANNPINTELELSKPGLYHEPCAWDLDTASP